MTPKRKVAPFKYYL